MSNTQDKKTKNKIEHAEHLWGQAQMKAAAMQQMLNIAINEFETYKEELEAEIITAIEQQIALRKKDLETFLMGEKDLYLERMGIQQD
jgi:hypothetical protein